MDAGAMQLKLMPSKVDIKMIGDDQREEMNSLATENETLTQKIYTC
jgi:hypothetical protein